MDFLLGELFYFYVSNLTANPASLSKFMIDGSANNVPTSIMRARDDAPYVLKEEGPIPIKRDTFDSNRTINAARHKPPKREDEQIDHHNAVKV